VASFGWLQPLAGWLAGWLAGRHFVAPRLVFSSFAFLASRASGFGRSGGLSGLLKASLGLKAKELKKDP